MRAFAQAERFVSDLQSRKLRAAYVFVGDEAFFRKRFRDAILEHLVPADLRDFSLFEFDLGDTDLAEVLDRARTPSLMAPFQVLFVRNLKQLYTRGSKKEEFAAIDAYFRSPNPQAVILFIADHLRIPTDLRKMDFQDKDRYEKIRESTGGVGAALLRARRCEGCRLELNPLQIQQIRAAAADEVVRCEECRRILVRTGESGL